MNKNLQKTQGKNISLNLPGSLLMNMKKKEKMKNKQKNWFMFCLSAKYCICKDNNFLQHREKDPGSGPYILVYWKVLKLVSTNCGAKKNYLFMLGKISQYKMFSPKFIAKKVQLKMLTPKDQQKMFGTICLAKKVSTINGFPNFFLLNVQCNKFCRNFQQYKGKHTLFSINEQQTKLK